MPIQERTQSLPRSEVFPPNANCVNPSSPNSLLDKGRKGLRIFQQASQVCKACPFTTDCASQAAEIVAFIASPDTRATVVGYREVQVISGDVYAAWLLEPTMQFRKDSTVTRPLENAQSPAYVRVMYRSVIDEFLQQELSERQSRNMAYLISKLTQEHPEWARDTIERVCEISTRILATNTFPVSTVTLATETILTDAAILQREGIAGPDDDPVEMSLRHSVEYYTGWKEPEPSAKPAASSRQAPITSPRPRRAKSSGSNAADSTDTEGDKDQIQAQVEPERFVHPSTLKSLQKTYPNTWEAELANHVTRCTAVAEYFDNNQEVTDRVVEFFARRTATFEETINSVESYRDRFFNAWVKFEKRGLDSETFTMIAEYYPTRIVEAAALWQRRYTLLQSELADVATPAVLRDFLVRNLRLEGQDFVTKLRRYVASLE